MQVLDLRLSGLKCIIPRLSSDERGYFFESYSAHRYSHTFVQDNISRSAKHTLRGLHFQSAPGQDKLITCLQGQIWDVAVDIRPKSPTFMQWEAILLDDTNHKQLFIPKGFAHGFCVLSDSALVQYKVSAPYDPNTEQSIRWNDPDLAINWPVAKPILSPRDQTSPFLKEVLDVTHHRS